VEAFYTCDNSGICKFREKRIEYWKTKLELYHSLGDAMPNDGHRALFVLEETNKLKGIITQNINGLHHLAGHSKKKILEIHGNNRETLCLQCGDLTDWREVYDRLKQGDDAPLCLKCDGLLKPNTISFGQNLNQQVLDMSFRWARECDLMLAIGSTLIVEPAASIPRFAKQHGAKLVVITQSETPLDALADLKIEIGTGECLKEAIIQRKESHGS